MRERNAALLLLLTSFIWGLSFVAQSVSSELVGPFTFNSVRLLIGAVVLMPLAIPRILKHRKEAGWLKRTLCAGIVCGILLAIGFKIIDFPLAIILGLFIGLLNMIPYLQTIGIIPMVILSLLRSAESGENFWIIFGLSLLVLGIVQCIQDLYLTPRIMGKAMGLNPAIILLSLSIWGILLGFIGLIIALPLTTLCLSYYKRFILEEKEPEPVPDNSKKTNK